jgi:3-hydroxyacyl-[acyl-carrier-protein] dehydratase
MSGARPGGGGAVPLDRLLDSLPQRPPALFVDHVLEHEHLRRVAGSVCFPPGHRVFSGHLPHEPLVPGVVLIEALAQLAGLALVGAEGEPVHGYLAEVGRVRFHRLVHPGEEVRLEARVDRAFGDYARFDVRALVGEELAAEGQVTVARRR